MGCLHSFSTDGVLKKHDRLCSDHDCCRIDKPEEGKNLLKYYPGEKPATFALYADFECLLIKEQSCRKNIERFFS